MMRLILILISGIFSSATGATNKCDISFPLEISRYVSLKYNLCATEDLIKGANNYDDCRVRVNKELSGFEKICDKAGYFMTNSQANYSECKAIRAMQRFAGQASPGDDRDICREYVLQKTTDDIIYKIMLNEFVNLR